MLYFPMGMEKTRWAFASSVKSAPHGYLGLQPISPDSSLSPQCPGGLHSADFPLEEYSWSWPVLCPASPAFSRSSSPVLCTTVLPPCWFSASNLFYFETFFFLKKKKASQINLPRTLTDHLSTLWSLLPALPARFCSRLKGFGGRGHSLLLPWCLSALLNHSDLLYVTVTLRLSGYPTAPVQAL